MDELYYNLEQKTKHFSNSFWLLSLLSWILLTITSFYSLNNIYNERAGILFTIIKYPLFIWYSKDLPYKGGTIYPLQMHPFFFYIIVIINTFIALTSLSALLFIIYKNKKLSIINEILSSINKFNFIPLFSVSFLFLIGESYEFNCTRWERRNILGLIFDIIGLITIIYLYNKTEIEYNSRFKYISLIIKNVGYSCIICLEWYYLCYLITNLFILYLPDDYYFSIIKYFGIILPIIFGFGSMIFSYIYKDLMIILLSSLISIGCGIYFFSIDKLYRNQYNKIIDGIIYITISILLIIEIFFVCNKTETKSKNHDLNIELRIMK